MGCRSRSMPRRSIQLALCSGHHYLYSRRLVAHLEVHGTGHIEKSYELDERTRDADLDMVLHFKSEFSGLTLSSTQACVKGRFVGAGGNIYKFFGCDSVKVVP